MKRILKENRYYFLLFFTIIVFSFLTGCTGTPQDPPIINYFNADASAIIEGETATLSWTVTNATIVTINQGIGDVDPSAGTYDVSPTETTTYTLTAFNDAGSSTAEVTITVSLAMVEQTITIQPGPNEGKDSFVSSCSPDDNFSDYVGFRIGRWDDKIRRSYLQFDLNTLPADAVITNADLKLYQSSTFGTVGFTISLFKITANWEENTITWNNQPDYHPIPESISSVIMGESTWLSWDVSTLLQEWVDGSITNHGIVLVGNTTVSFSEVFFRSSDYLDTPDQRPKLEITYLVPAP